MGAKARGTHDLNNTHTLRIYGWSGDFAVVDADGTWVEVETTPRDPEESWTFARPVDGVLSCHTSLLGSPNLLAAKASIDGEPLFMTIKVPPARQADLLIEVFPNRKP